jgi:hypothetical protein
MKNINTNINTRNASARKSATRSTTNEAVRSIAKRSTGNTARTPYHSLGGEDGMRIPSWAQHRSVYRAAGRTHYLVETDRFDDAQLDLKRLARAGWDVRVTEDSAAHITRIALTRRELAQAA